MVDSSVKVECRPLRRFIFYTVAVAMRILNIVAFWAHTLKDTQRITCIFQNIKCVTAMMSALNIQYIKFDARVQPSD